MLAALHLDVKVFVSEGSLAARLDYVDVHRFVSGSLSASLICSRAPMIPISEPMARGLEKIFFWPVSPGKNAVVSLG
jgi:hypothetical protein